MTQPACHPSTLANLLSSLGSILYYCEHCSDPIFGGDDLETYSRSDEGAYHGRCLYEMGSLAPVGFWRTDDLAWQLRQAGIDPRSVKMNDRDIPILNPITTPIREINLALFDDDTIEPVSCYICGTDDPEDDLSLVNLPTQTLYVCCKCKVSSQHEQTCREEFELERAEL